MGNSTNHFTNEEENLKSSYYEIVNKTIQRRYIKNKNDLFNQRYSLFEKDFQKCYINQKIVMTPLERRFIPWKSYLMRRLINLSEEHGCIWAKNLYNYVSNESFPNQNKYQNMFFYQEFQILTKPRIKKGKEEDLDEDDPFESIRARISNNLMASFNSGDSSFLNSNLEEDPNYEYQYNKNKIKEYIEIFRKHISLKEHPINIIITAFIKEYIPFINDAIEFYNSNSNLNKIGCQEKADDIINRLQDFITIMQNVIKLFYSRSISYSFFKDEKDEFLNLVCFFIFNSEKIYTKFFRLFELMNMDKASLLKDKLELLGDLQPEEMGIKDKFCLNEKTNNFIKTLKEKKKDSKSNDDKNTLSYNFNGEEKNIEDIAFSNSSLNNKKDDIIDTNIINKDNDNTIRTDSNMINNQEPLKISSDSGKLYLFTKRFSIMSEGKDYSKEPYGQAIEFLKKIIDFKVPLEKLIIIASISSLITECVNNYWKKVEKLIQPSMLNIDADELMTIFMYIVYKCNMPSLFVHADFIKYFTSPTTKSTMIGYYYTTLQGCLDFLLQIKNKQEFTRESL
jgi:hypothetical protein